MKRIEIDVLTGSSREVDLTPEEVAAAQAQHAAWQIQENARLAAVAAEEARQAKFEEWLATQQP